MIDSNLQPNLLSHGASETEARSFTGISRLYGQPASERLSRASVMVIGIGGVGSWAVEALARSGVGRLILVDMDVIAESNINRQIHALDHTLGRNKIDVMKERVTAINQQCEVVVVDEFLTLDNYASLLSTHLGSTQLRSTQLSLRDGFVIDAIDSPRVKAQLIAHCVQTKTGIVVAGAAGGRDNPLALHQQDLAVTTGDALLANTRGRLRRDFGFSRVKGELFKVPTVCSTQQALPTQGVIPHEVNRGAPLNCAGYGSIVTVTATMGLALASIAIKSIIKAKK